MILLIQLLLVRVNIVALIICFGNISTGVLACTVVAQPRVIIVVLNHCGSSIMKGGVLS